MEAIPCAKALREKHLQQSKNSKDINMAGKESDQQGEWKEVNQRDHQGLANFHSE